MARNGCGLSEIAGSLAHNTYRIIEDIIADSIRDSFKGEIKMIVYAIPKIFIDFMSTLLCFTTDYVIVVKSKSSSAACWRLENS